MQPFTIHFETTSKYPGKLADCELRFTDDAGPLAGLKLAGFGIWQRRCADADGRYNVTMPARQYSVNGERRSYALLRPTVDTTQIEALRGAIVAAWRAQQNPEPYRPAYVPTTYDTTPAPVPAPVDYANIQRYDNPDDAARAAQAGTPINILDLIRQADHTNASETREHHRPTVRPAMPQAKPKPGYTPAGDLIGF